MEKRVSLEEAAAENRNGYERVLLVKIGDTSRTGAVIWMAPRLASFVSDRNPGKVIKDHVLLIEVEDPYDDATAAKAKGLIGI